MTPSVSFDRAASYYDQTRGFPAGIEAGVAGCFVDAALSCGIDPAAARALEIGVGTGRIALPLAPHLAGYSGIDISGAMMGILRAREQPTARRIDLAYADAARLPFAAGAFDLGIAVHVFHLIGDPAGALREVARVLRPGGVLLHGWNMDTDQETLREVWNRALGLDGRATSHLRNHIIEENGWIPRGDPHVVRYTVTRTAAAELAGIRGRIWSSCWKLTDAQLEQGERAILAYIAEHGIDLDAPISTRAGFAVQVFIAPT
jgi:SAM-dependent methyltransferase